MAASETRVAEANRSFERLYRTHRRDVYNFVLHDVRNPDDAEDVTQLAFLNAYRALRAGRPPEKPRAWLLTIAQNVCRRRFRQRAANVREVPLDADLAVAAADDYDGPTADEIYAAFRKLPPNQRMALAMREIQGRPYAEIARELQLSLPAVETLIFRARRALRTHLEPEESRLRGLVLLPLAVPGLIAKAFDSVAASIGRAGFVSRTAGVVGAVVVGTGVGVKFVPPLLAADEAPAAEVVVARSGEFAERGAPPPPVAKVDAGGGKEDAKATKATKGTKGKGGAPTGDDAAGAVEASGPLPALPEVPEVPVQTPTLPNVTVPLELPELPTVEVPTVPLPPPPSLDTPELG